jgi:CheY-like chemotaxis protein
MPRIILVVDDDEDIRETLRIALELQGYHVLTAGNGREALDALRRGPRPGMILLDLMMPVLDGWTFAEALDKDPALSDLPILVITAYADRARPVPNALLTIEKPFDLPLLLDAISQRCL